MDDDATARGFPAGTDPAGSVLASVPFPTLDAARAAARAEGKPILVLRLLGQLDEDYSCTNSRYFRTTLYPTETVSQRLKEHFVLRHG